MRIADRGGGTLNRKIAILVAAMMLLVPMLSAIPGSADAADGSIPYVSYDMDEGKLSFTGSTSSVSNGTLADLINEVKLNMKKDV